MAAQFPVAPPQLCGYTRLGWHNFTELGKAFSISAVALLNLLVYTACFNIDNVHNLQATHEATHLNRFSESATMYVTNIHILTRQIRCGGAADDVVLPHGCWHFVC